MTEPLRVLLVEDSATDAKLVLRELQRTGRSIEHERVETGDAMRSALEQKSWDIVISDWALPAFSAVAALELLQEMQLDLPLIIASGTIGEAAAVDVMRAGAHDYVLKDNLARLAPAVERELREHQHRKARHQAELARGEADLRFRRLFESRITGVLISDMSGNITEANDTFLDMVGHSRDDLNSSRMNWLEMTPNEWRAASTAAKVELRAGASVLPFEKEYLRKDGTRVPVLVGAALLDENRYLTIVTDLTDLKLAEARKAAAEQATVALEEQLRQSQKMDAVGRLAGGIAHDFNNLLSVILSYGEMILGDLKPGDPLRDDVEQIHKAGSRAADMTRQLLMFSRQQLIQPKVLGLDDLLSGMDKMLRRLVGEDVELVSIAGAAVGRVRVDPGSIEQVIMNLAINARDAMPTGGKLTMETANVLLDDQYAASHLGAKPGLYVVLSVTDNGIGMERATLSRIFEPFFTTKETGKGTGLGLSTVFGIVQQTGGHVWVNSEPGLGTTFKVYLPRVDAAAEESQAPRAASTLRGSETILLVEDEEQVRNAARGILRRHGYTVIEARNAGEAILHCEQHVGPIHLLLSDVVMPGMSGPALAKRLAQGRPEMRVLCMSGYTDDTAVRHGVLDAAFAYLQKPLTVETLTRKVREVLDSSRKVG